MPALPNIPVRQKLSICYSTHMSSAIVYEHPLNERIRVFLRLEHFFHNVQFFLHGTNPVETQAGITALIEILTVLERTDVRSELLKELDRQISGLSKLFDAPAVDKLRLDAILEKLSDHIQQLQEAPSKNLSEVRDLELLNSIRQRAALAGTCGFDLPAYHYLVNQPTDLRNEYLSRWSSDLSPLKNSIELLLSMLRSSALFDRQIAENGFYQRVLDSQNPCQLLRICMPPNSGVYPEVSGSKHRVNIRFLTFTEHERAKQINERQEFDLSCCVI